MEYKKSILENVVMGKGTVLVTGNSGYIGMVMTQKLLERGYRVVGLDTKFYEGCSFFPGARLKIKQIVKDIRQVGERDLEGVDAIFHLAALSNDPLGEINPQLALEINYRSSVRLAKLAKKAGVRRFLFSSSCSQYGVSKASRPLTEAAPQMPVTAYAISKVKTEKALMRLADKSFHPVMMRNTTVYGSSPSLRLDLVVNNLAAWAVVTGEIKVMSDGRPWRPLIHVEDLCEAFMAVMEAPVDKVDNQAFNVGLTEENYQVREIAELVAKQVPNSRVRILNQGDKDERSYRVDFSKLRRTVKGFKPKWNLMKGIVQLVEDYNEFKLDKADLEGERYFRVRWIKYLLATGKLDKDLFWIN